MAKLTSGVWGGKSFEVSQPFGVYNPDTAYMYAYAANLGFPAGTHVGIDVAMPRGTPIYAATDGVVTQAGPSRYFRPNPIWIQTDDNPATTAHDDELHIYGHLWENTVDVGQTVQRGQLIGYSGEQTVAGTMTPDGTGPHLHFERRNGDNTKALNPTRVLTGANFKRDDASSNNDSDADATSGDQADDSAAQAKSLTDKAAAVGGRIGLGLLGLVALALAIALVTGATPLDVVPAGRALKAVAKVAAPK